MRARAAEVIEAYEGLAGGARTDFFRFLLDEMSVDHEALDAATRRYHRSQDHGAVAALSAAAEPVRRDFMRLLNTAPDGTQAVIAMRSHLLTVLDGDPELRVLDEDFLHVLRSWFNRGFLTLVRLDWSTPAFILEKLIEYEAVHAIRGWSDLHRRLQEDRRLYAYMHPALPDEPLIFVEVALADRLLSSIEEVLHQPVAVGDAEPTTAMFYSITNTQPGLRGITFGNFLIKQVMAELQATMPSLETFATLSPLPGLLSWLRRQDAAGQLGWMPSDSRRRLAALDDTAWVDFPQTREALQPGLLQAAARYLYQQKRPGTAPPQPLDPVARFHVGNGARLHRLNWMGDPSPKGLAESAGILVNYVYDPDQSTANLERHAADGSIAVGEEVLALVEGPEDDLAP